MTAWDRVAVWNRNRAKNATFQFVSDDSDADIWMLDNETKEKTLLSVEDIKLLERVFGGPK